MVDAVRTILIFFMWSNSYRKCKVILKASAKTISLTEHTKSMILNTSPSHAIQSGVITRSSFKFLVSLNRFLVISI